MVERKRSKKTEEILEAYRRIRKAIPPPEKVVPDKRRKHDEEVARRELREGS